MYLRYKQHSDSEKCFDLYINIRARDAPMIASSVAARSAKKGLGSLMLREPCSRLQKLEHGCNVG